MDSSTAWEERQISDREWFDQKYQFEDYPRHKIHDQSFVRALTRKLRLRPPSKLLDLGCGMGWYSFLFSEMGFGVTGADMSEVGIQEAQRLYSLEQIDWVIGDGLELDFQNHFDVVHLSNFSPFTMVESLASENAQVIVHKILGYLKKNGTLIFVWNSRLDESDPEGTWFNYSVKQIASYFGAIVNTELLGVWATHAQLSTILGIYAFSKPVTQLSNFGAKIHSKTARIVATVRKV